MAFETTLTEKDLDYASRTFVQGFGGSQDAEPDLRVDGLSDTLLSRVLGLFGIGR